MQGGNLVTTVVPVHIPATQQARHRAAVNVTQDLPETQALHAPRASFPSKDSLLSTCTNLGSFCLMARAIPTGQPKVGPRVLSL